MRKFRKRSFVLRGGQEGHTAFNLAPSALHLPHPARVLSSASCSQLRWETSGPLPQRLLCEQIKVYLTSQIN